MEAVTAIMPRHLVLPMTYSLINSRCCVLLGRVAPVRSRLPHLSLVNPSTLLRGEPNQLAADAFLPTPIAHVLDDFVPQNRETVFVRG
jgi:hypothetical protein